MGHFEIDGASQALRAQGLRMTNQRRMILEALKEAEAHLDAEQLYQCLRERDQSVSLATVYRTLNVLHKAGLVEQRFLDEDHSRGYYEVRQREHYHFTCRECGKVIEFESDLVEEIALEVAERHAVQVQRTRVHFEGLCAECLEKPRR